MVPATRCGYGARMATCSNFWVYWPLGLVFACNAGGGGDAGGEETGVTSGPTEATGEPATATLAGAVQKGPFILGTTIGVSPLTAGGDPVGAYFEAAAGDDAGAFTIAGIPAGPVSLAAVGFYFDELRGALSGAPLTLRAVHHAIGGMSTVHVHPLTHLVEPRARALMAGGLDVDAALAQAEGEAVAALGIGAPGFALVGSAGAASVTGVDSDDNAYAFAVGVVFAAVGAAGDPDAPEAALQLALNTAAAALADGQGLPAELAAELAAAEQGLDAAGVQAALDARLAALGLPPGPDIRRALDQDFDGLANIADNCPLHANPGQDDGDGDGAGDACDACDGSPEDSDGDGVQDGCDNCPDDANPREPFPNQPDAPMWQPDADDDGLGDACDACPRVAGLGEVAGENCCDPRETGVCTGVYPGDQWPRVCMPDSDEGDRFSCFWRGGIPCVQGYATDCRDCDEDQPCMPQGGLQKSANCLDWECKGPLRSIWCTVGDDAACGAGNVCLAWWKDGEAPVGVADLGVCASPNGSCEDKAGRECAIWNPVILP